MPKLFRGEGRRFSPPPRRRLLIGCLLGIGLLFGLFAAFVWDDGGDVWRQARRQVDTLNALAAETLERDVKLYDLALQGVVETARTPQAASVPRPILRAAMFGRVATLRGLHALFVVDDQGQAFLDADPAKAQLPSVADRDFFLAQKFASGDSGLFISQPFREAPSGAWRIGLSRRILRADGGFGGAAVAVLDVSAIETLLAGMEPEPNGAVSRLARDGTASAPVRGERLQPASLWPDRIESTRRIGGSPLFVATSLSTADVLSPWFRRSTGLGLALLLVGGCTLLVLRRLGRELGRRASADLALAGLAKTDALTGLANRRSFDERLDLEWRRAERDASHFSLLMLDGDCFKAYNDTFGHIEGDKALKAIADTLRRALQRPGDLAARYGGEEFSVLLPATDQASALLVAERIRQSVFDMQMKHPRNPYGVATVSIGLATVKPRYVGHPTELVRAADHALYEAKASGRNRVVAARTPESATAGQPESVAA